MRSKLAVLPKRPEAELRPLIREALRASRENVSFQRIADEIEELRPKLYGTDDPATPISKHTVRRFFSGPEAEDSRVSTTSLRIFYRYALEIGAVPRPEAEHPEDAVYAALTSFFAVSPAAVDAAARELVGDYEFYVKSESHSGQKPYIVRGALRFSKDPKTGAVLVHERRSTRSFPGPDENWRGYAFVSKGTAVLVLHNDEKTASHEMPPKFYILGLPEIRTSEGKVFELKGRMMKVAVSGGVFTSRIVFRRCDTAFDQADIVDADTVDKVIRNAVLIPAGDQ